MGFKIDDDMIIATITSPYKRFIKRVLNDL